MMMKSVMMMMMMMMMMIMITMMIITMIMITMMMITMIMVMIVKKSRTIRELHDTISYMICLIIDKFQELRGQNVLFYFVVGN